MDKLKGMLKISERDKKLLVVVLAVLIMAVSYTHLTLPTKLEV